MEDNDVELILPSKEGPAILSYPGGVFVFPKGITSFCEAESLKLMNVDEEGNVFVLRNEGTEWESYPYEQPKTAVIKSIN